MKLYQAFASTISAKSIGCCKSRQYSCFSTYWSRYYTNFHIDLRLVTCFLNHKGKTLIAVSLIQERLFSLRKNMSAGGKKKLILFIAPTKILTGQQKKYIANHRYLYAPALDGVSTHSLFTYTKNL